MSSSAHYKRKYPLLLCLVAPVASGKSTICQALVQSDARLRLSISTTTRPPREGEVDQEHYYFVSDAEFEHRVQSGQFIEYAVVGKYRYGTERRNVDSATSYDILFDIDVEGVLSLKRAFPAQTRAIFVFPPSFDELQRRLEARATDSAPQRESRLTLAKTEIERLQAPGVADYLVRNEKLEDAIRSAQAILEAERSRFDALDPQYLAALFSVSQ